MSDARERLIESATTAHRRVRSDFRIAAHPAFYDLDAKSRIELYEATVVSRRIEAALNEWGLSTTALAVLRMVEKK